MNTNPLAIAAGEGIDPEVLIRMLLVGYCFGIRPEQRRCEEVHWIAADTAYGSTDILVWLTLERQIPP